MLQQNTIGMQTTMLSPGAGMPQDTLELAATLLDRSLHVDRNYAELSELLQIPKHSMYLRLITRYLHSCSFRSVC